MFVFFIVNELLDGIDGIMASSGQCSYKKKRRKKPTIEFNKNKLHINYAKLYLSVDQSWIRISFSFYFEYCALSQMIGYARICIRVEWNPFWLLSKKWPKKKAPEQKKRNDNGQWSGMNGSSTNVFFVEFYICRFNFQCISEICISSDCRLSLCSWYVIRHAHTQLPFHK